MANPAYFQSSPLSQETRKNELRFHLYMYQHLQGTPNGNQQVVVDSKRPQSFGCIAANDWTIYDGLGPDASLVARAQGLHIGAGMTKENWFVCFNMVFTDDRFKGSSFKVLGDFQMDEGEFAMVGGTGEFAFAAQGVVTFKNKYRGVEKGKHKGALYPGTVPYLPKTIDIAEVSKDQGFDDYFIDEDYEF